MQLKTDKEKLAWGNAAAWEAEWASREWRAESWRDCEIVDGGDSAWTQDDWDSAVDAGVDPITVNRAHPSIQKLIGTQVINRLDITAKARTSDDGEIAQVMTEGIKYVMDQYGADFLISQAYANALVPGFGCIAPCYNPDPRMERVAIKYRDWREVKWDPFSSPWWSPETTKYVYWQPWIDVEDFQQIFPNKKKEIENAYNDILGQSREYGASMLMDEATLKEEKLKTLATSDWIDRDRKRIRPVEMWYPQIEDCLFSLFADGRCFEIVDGMDPHEAYELIKTGNQVIKAPVKKMRTMTFFGEHLLLQDIKTPYNHHQFPLVPFVGYLDRWGFPYGVPRQIRGESAEINKRRSMAIAMLKKRRLTIEESAVSPKGNREMLDELYREANKIDGMMVLADGGLSKYKLEEMAQLSPYQINLLHQAETEIRDITGSDAPYFAGEQGQSGVAKQQDQIKSAVTTASLLDHLRRSMSMIGYQTSANIQGAWKYEKVLRVTDRATGAEKFVHVNQPINGGIAIKNDITQSKFDIVIAETQASDTVREKNMDLLYQAIAKSPPEVVPTLLIAAFELSDLPNKEALVEKLKPMLGVDPTEGDMDPAEVKKKVLAELDAQKKQSAANAQLQNELLQTKLLEAKLNNAKLKAEVAKISAETEKTKVETAVEAESHDAQMDREGAEGLERGLAFKKNLEEPKKGDGDDAT